MADEKKNSTDQRGKSHEEVLIRKMIAGTQRFEQWAKEASLPDDATAFDAIARYEGWSEETIQAKRTLSKISELLETCAEPKAKQKALYYAAEALGLEPEGHLPPETVGEKKAECVRIARWHLWSWRKWRPRNPGSKKEKWELGEAQDLIRALGEIWPGFSKLKRENVLARLRQVNGKTSGHSFVRGLADLVDVWPGEDKDSLRKEWQRNHR